MPRFCRSFLWIGLCAAGIQARAQSPPNVLVVVNENSSLSRNIGDYYARARRIPPANVCRLRAPETENMTRSEYNRFAAAVGSCLRKNQLTEQIYYIALTQGIPLRVAGNYGLEGDSASVDSELALLYGELHGAQPHPVKGFVKNPFFGKRDEAFTHAAFPIYLVTRLAAYELTGVKALIDRSLAAKNRGKFVIDLRSADDESGNSWLRTAALLLPADRVVFDESDKVLYKQTDVIGLASWGSNDRNRRERYVGFQWLPGAIATEFVSTNGRTFQRPPKTWNLSDWSDASQPKWFVGSPQSMTLDYIDEGASAATGHTAEPYLANTPRPEFLLPAYFKGRTLAESYYLSIPALSWQNIVIGDPLMTLGPPRN